MAKAHIEVSNADELVAAVFQTQSVQIKQAQQDFYKGIQVYAERYPLYSRWVRVFIAQAVVSIVGFIVTGAIAVIIITEYPGKGKTALICALVFLGVYVVSFSGAMVMRHKQRTIPRPKRR